MQLLRSSFGFRRSMEVMVKRPSYSSLIVSVVALVNSDDAIICEVVHSPMPTYDRDAVRQSSSTKLAFGLFSTMSTQTETMKR
eukprot:scaffold393_cov158-Skeletonema_dohrnii-CCMP3373.AAC.4